MNGISISSFPPQMVKLTERYSGVMYVNKNHIVTMELCRTHPDKIHTKIILINDSTLYVDEMPETILTITGKV